MPTRRQACLGRVHALASRVRDLPGRRRPTTSVSSASTVTPRAAAEATAPSALGRRHDGAGGAARADDGAQQPADQPARPRLLRRSRGRPGCLRRRVACGGARPGGRGAPAAASSRRPEWLIGRSPAGLAAPPSSHQLPPTHRWQRCRRGGRRAAAAGRRRGLRRRGEARPASAAAAPSPSAGFGRGPRTFFSAARRWQARERFWRGRGGGAWACEAEEAPEPGAGAGQTVRRAPGASAPSWRAEAPPHPPCVTLDTRAPSPFLDRRRRVLVRSARL